MNDKTGKYGELWSDAMNKFKPGDVYLVNSDDEYDDQLVVIRKEQPYDDSLLRNMLSCETDIPSIEDCCPEEVFIASELVKIGEL